MTMIKSLYGTILYVHRNLKGVLRPIYIHLILSRYHIFTCRHNKINTLFVRVINCNCIQLHTPNRRFHLCNASSGCCLGTGIENKQNTNTPTLLVKLDCLIIRCETEIQFRYYFVIIICNINASFRWFNKKMTKRQPKTCLLTTNRGRFYVYVVFTGASTKHNRFWKIKKKRMLLTNL